MILSRVIYVILAVDDVRRSASRSEEHLFDLPVTVDSVLKSTRGENLKLTNKNQTSDIFDIFFAKTR